MSDLQYGVLNAGGAFADSLWAFVGATADIGFNTGVTGMYAALPTDTNMFFILDGVPNNSVGGVASIDTDGGFITTITINAQEPGVTPTYVPSITVFDNNTGFQYGITIDKENDTEVGIRLDANEGIPHAGYKFNASGFYVNKTVTGTTFAVLEDGQILTNQVEMTPPVGAIVGRWPIRNPAGVVIGYLPVFAP